MYTFVKYMIISKAHVAYFHDFDLFFFLSVSCFERFIYSCFLICICRLIYSFCCIANKCLFKWGKYKKRCLTQNLCMIQLYVKDSRISHFLLFDFSQLSPLFKYFLRFLSLYIHAFSRVSKYLCVCKCMRFCWW